MMHSMKKVRDRPRSLIYRSTGGRRVVWLGSQAGTALTAAGMQAGVSVCWYHCIAAHVAGGPTCRRVVRLAMRMPL